LIQVSFCVDFRNKYYSNIEIQQVVQIAEKAFGLQLAFMWKTSVFVN